MDTLPQGDLHHPLPDGPSLSRRGFLRGSVLAGGGLIAAAVAACSPIGQAGWTYPPAPSTTAAGSSGASGSSGGSPAASAALPTASGSATAGGSPAASAMPSASIPAGWSEHDVAAKAAVDRFLGGEYAKVTGAGNQPLAPRIVESARVFDLTIDRISHRIDAMSDPVDALGYNGTWPGPILRVTEGDLVRATFTNNLAETTSVHFHGQHLPNAMDGVPLITQPPIVPGASFTYEFVAQPFGSHMYHSHHNATDQVGRGLLGAFIVEPKDPKQRYDALYGVTQEVVWISNDEIGGFTINGRGFPATAPIVAKKGEKVLIRFMNEGLMTHPWHLHGMHFQVVARDGWPLGSAAFRCDTLGVNPGERYDVVIDCDNPGAWAFHCHILTHAEGQHGMFGMVTALIVS
ncbi:MAG: multicopper oxidase family protein [Chloroflexi bacterium]|nr:multicopper oxidase family protein [Chloroflexota bacterium]